MSNINIKLDLDKPESPEDPVKKVKIIPPITLHETNHNVIGLETTFDNILDQLVINRLTNYIMALFLYEPRMGLTLESKQIPKQIRLSHNTILNALKSVPDNDIFLLIYKYKTGIEDTLNPLIDANKNIEINVTQQHLNQIHLDFKKAGYHTYVSTPKPGDKVSHIISII